MQITLSEESCCVVLLCCFKRVPLVVAAPRSDQLLQGEIAEKEGKVEREKRSSAVQLVVVMVMDQWTL